MEEALLAAAVDLAAAQAPHFAERARGLARALLARPQLAGDGGKPVLADILLLALRAAGGGCTAAGGPRCPWYADYIRVLGASLRGSVLPPDGRRAAVALLREALQGVVGQGDGAAAAAALRGFVTRVEAVAKEVGLPHPGSTECHGAHGTSAQGSIGDAEGASKQRRRHRAGRRHRHKGGARDTEAAADGTAATASAAVEAVAGVAGGSAVGGSSAAGGGIAAEALWRPSRQRLATLAKALASQEVQFQAPEEAEEVPAQLSPEEVAKVFEDHVPGVRQLIYRQQQGVYSINFIQGAYKDGFRAFQGTDLHGHLTSLMRLIVHHGHAGKPGAKEYLREVAEAFTDCQAVQARTIERVGLRIRGVQLDFRGHLVRLVDEYKAVAVKMLAVEECTKLGGPDEHLDPAHFESRLLMDLGEECGLNKADIKQAHLDGHAEDRFAPMRGKHRQLAAERLLELLDCEALLKAFAAEVNSFGTDSAKDSLPSLFLEWCEQRLTVKHVVLDEDTCSRVEVGDELALAVFEAVFLGKPCSPAAEMYRGQPLLGLFKPAEATNEAEAPKISEDKPDRLTEEEVRKVFIDNVPGVEGLLYGQQQGNHSLTSQ